MKLERINATKEVRPRVATCGGEIGAGLRRQCCPSRCAGYSRGCPAHIDAGKGFKPDAGFPGCMDEAEQLEIERPLKEIVRLRR